MWVCTQNEDALYHVIAVRAVRMISERSYSVIGILPGEKEPVVHNRGAAARSGADDVRRRRSHGRKIERDGA